MSQFQRSTGMNLFLSQMTFQGAGPGNVARAVAVEADMTRINYSMGRLVQAVYRHSILAHGLLLPPAFVSVYTLQPLALLSLHPP